MNYKKNCHATSPTMEPTNWASQSDGNAFTSCVSWTCHWSSQLRNLGNFVSLRLDLTPHLGKFGEQTDEQAGSSAEQPALRHTSPYPGSGNRSFCGSDTPKTIVDWIGEEEEEEECRT